MRYPVGPKKNDWWWDADGKLIQTGYHWPGIPVTGKDTDTLHGRSFTQEQLDQARKLSLSVPCPFLRIDFLRDGNSARFTEFTTYTGNITSINRRTDRMLGKLYLQAEMRLTQDLLDGKEFKEIKEFNRICEERYGKH